MTGFCIVYDTYCTNMIFRSTLSHPVCILNVVVHCNIFFLVLLDRLLEKLFYLMIHGSFPWSAFNFLFVYSGTIKYKGMLLLCIYFLKN